jgi:hypothetical protein
MLEGKEKDSERLKRSVAKLQKENVQLKNDMRKSSKAGYLTTQSSNNPIASAHQ